MTPNSWWKTWTAQIRDSSCSWRKPIPPNATLLPTPWLFFYQKKRKPRHPPIAENLATWVNAKNNWIRFASPKWNTEKIWGLRCEPVQLLTFPICTFFWVRKRPSFLKRTKKTTTTFNNQDFFSQRKLGNLESLKKIWILCFFTNPWYDYKPAMLQWFWYVFVDNFDAWLPYEPQIFVGDDTRNKPGHANGTHQWWKMMMSRDLYIGKMICTSWWRGVMEIG